MRLIWQRLELELPTCLFVCELRIEQSSTVQHGTGDVEEPVNDRPQGARMAVAFGPEGVVFGPTCRVEPNRILRPVIGGVSQALIAGIPAHHHAALPLRRVTGADPHKARNA